MEEMVNRNAEQWRGRKVLVTGHTGFKGRWLVAWLRKWGAEVTGFSIDEGCRNPALRDPLPAGCDNIFGDIRDSEAVYAALERSGAEVVFHLAAQPIVSIGYSEPVETYSTNVMGTVGVLEAVRRRGSEIRAVIVVTSDKCYENREWVWAYRESDSVGGRDPYSNSKGCAELVTQAYRASFFASPTSSLIASVRAGNVIGPGDWAPVRLVPDLARALAEGRAAEIRRPHSIRPWQHVLEPLSGYLSVATRLLQPDASFAEAWNFGPHHEDEQPVTRIADLICDAWGKPSFWSDVSEAGAELHEAHTLKIDFAQSVFAARMDAYLPTGGSLAADSRRLSRPARRHSLGAGDGGANRRLPERVAGQQPIYASGKMMLRICRPTDERSVPNRGSAS